MEALTLNKEKTALVVIDLQKGIVGMDTKPHAASDVVKNSAHIAEVFRTNGMPVFLVRVTPSADMRDALAPITDGPARSFGDMPADWADIVSEMNKVDSDFVITKHQWGAFYGTELDLQLRRRGIDTIILCGISTNIGVESTARNAYELGFNQVFIEDAMAASSEEEHQMAIEKTFPRMGRVRSTEEVLGALR